MIIILGIQFGSYHTFADWGLRWAASEIEEAKAKTYFIEVPGRDGVIDLTEVLVPEVKFNTRLLKFAFVLLGSHAVWQQRYSQVSNALNGKYIGKIILDTDKANYWSGRCAVTSTKADGVYSSIDIAVDADPYKYDLTVEQGNKWLWDIFSFRDGVILQTNITVNGTKILTVRNSRKIVPLTIICSSSMTASFEGQTYPLYQGTNNPGILLREGDNTLTLTGTGTVTLQYKRGSL